MGLGYGADGDRRDRLERRLELGQVVARAQPAGASCRAVGRPWSRRPSRLPGAFPGRRRPAPGGAPASHGLRVRRGRARESCLEVGRSCLVHGCGGHGQGRPRRDPRGGTARRWYGSTARCRRSRRAIGAVGWVRCDPVVAATREKARIDPIARIAGMATSQVTRVHHAVRYDMVVEVSHSRSQRRIVQRDRSRMSSRTGSLVDRREAKVPSGRRGPTPSMRRDESATVLAMYMWTTTPDYLRRCVLY